MRRPGWGAGALTLLAALALMAPPARAQAPAEAIGVFPTRTAVRFLPLGSFSEFRMSRGERTFNLRLAVVANNAKENVVTIELTGDPGPEHGKNDSKADTKSDGKSHTTVDYVIDTTQREDRLKTLLVKMGDRLPYVDNYGGGVPFKEVDRRLLKGEEVVKVPAGEFKAEHYQEVKPGGDVWDFWISERAGAFGVVKLTRQGPTMGVETKRKYRQPLTMELVNTGTGARGGLTGPFGPAPNRGGKRAGDAGAAPAAGEAPPAAGLAPKAR